MKTRCIIIQGTMSDAGKSVVCAALCRIFKQDGFKAAPFKSQNMALNSYITRDGFEMGRAQVMQAEAAGIEPDVRMNPVLLKPSSDTGSQIIVLGEVRGRELDVRHLDVVVFGISGNVVQIILGADDVGAVCAFKQCGCRFRRFRWIQRA